MAVAKRPSFGTGRGARGGGAARHAFQNGVHTKGLAAPGCDRLGLEQKPAGEQAKLRVARRGGDGSFERVLPGLVTSRRMNGGSACFMEQVGENFGCRALKQVKLAAAVSKIAVERGEAPMQPPARGAAHPQSPGVSTGSRAAPVFAASQSAA